MSAGLVQREDEASRLRELETIVTAGLESFVAVGEALAEIRDDKLYRLDGFSTFEHYCRERFGLSERRAYQAMDAASVAEAIEEAQEAQSEGCTVVQLFNPANEAQARELVPLLGNPTALVGVLELLGASTKPLTAAAVREEVGRALGHPAIPPSTVPYSDEWYSAAEVVEAGRRALGGLDLDPASCEVANATVQAAKFFDEATDGLSQEWRGRVWLNPPFSDGPAFIEKLMSEYEAGRVEAAVLLVAARTDTAWFQPLLRLPVCFLRARRQYWHPNGSASAPTFPSVCVYLGPDPAAFIAAFQELGVVVGPL